MTEKPLSITTQIATPTQSAFNTTPLVSANDALPVAESEEPYTIKCICGYSDDDGLTVYCETCDTWQHLECFYIDRMDDAKQPEFDHSCADCKPRALDRKGANERQRLQRQNKAINDTGDRRTKRPPSKSHKKKSKPTDLQVNGDLDHDGHQNGSPKEHQPHTKKSKGHRSKESISHLKRSPPYNARPHNHAHPPSPAHTPPDLPNNFQVHGYSDNFLTLYDNNPTAELSSTNSFASLSVTNSMSLWLHEPERLRDEAGVQDKNDVFQYLKVNVESLSWPALRVERKETVLNDVTLQWRMLVTPKQLPEPGRIAELNGLVGFQKDYCSDIDNRWQDSVHPRPFVFFHPRLPLFIDTRQEGSICRYVRRSCRPNTNIETFVSRGGSEYHFWLTSERSLAANEQITIPWDFRFPSTDRSRFLHLLNLGDEDGAPYDNTDITDEEYDQLTGMINLVLSDYGGCACDLGGDCAFARFHRNYHGRSQPQSNGVKSKKTRKPKQIHVSPTSTGHATNSRAASEGQQDHYDEDDNRSSSSSTRSKPQSRDMTPSQGLVEMNGILTEPTDREKRKLAMVEDSFRKMEQGQPPRKKKRASDGANVNLPTSQATPKPRQRSVVPRMPISQTSTSTTNGLNGSRPRQYVDASTRSRRQSGSPFSNLSPTAALPSPENAQSRPGSIAYRSRQASIAPRGSYTDSSTQTDEVENAWWNDPKPAPKRTVIPLAKRLLKNRHRIQAQQEVHSIQQGASACSNEDQNARASPTASMDLDVPMHEDRSVESPTEAKGRNVSISSSTPSIDVSSTSVDVNMIDAPIIHVGNITKPLPPPWPAQSNHISTGILASHGHKSPDLRVQMPPAPTFSTPNMSGPPSGSITPSSATGSLAQSPFGTVHFPSSFAAATVNGIGPHPSPVKTTKKLSLSDYKAARMKKTDTSNKSSSGSSPTVAPAVLKPPLSTIEEAKAKGILEGSAIVDSPMVEKSIDPMVSSAGPISDPVLKNNMPSGKSNGTL
jgi:uncharacterized protein